MSDDIEFDRGSLSRTRAFVLLRYTLIVATAYLLLVENGFRLPPLATMLLIVAALGSNVAFTMFPPRLLESTYFDAAVILADTTWITIGLLQSGRFASDFFYLYFFVLLLAAIGENLQLIALGALFICGAYVYLYSAAGGSWSFWTSPSLIRIPFLFTVAACYGYLVDRTRRERQRAAEADQIKTEFLATVSHELRTPLNVMLGYVDLLLEHSFGPLEPEEEKVLRQVQTAGRNLHGFITRLLDVSRIVTRIQSGHERVACTDVDLATLFNDLRTEFPSELTVPVRWPNGLAIPVMYTDGDKLRSIVRNLVDNAVKYTANGLVSVDACFLRDADQVEISVTDTGEGIARAELPHIFQPFRSGAHRADGGAVGLGLYVVKEFVDLLGGTVEIESRLGAGSTFRVVLPRMHRDRDERVTAG